MTCIRTALVTAGHFMDNQINRHQHKLVLKLYEYICIPSKQVQFTFPSVYTIIFKFDVNPLNYWLSSYRCHNKNVLIYFITLAMFYFDCEL